MLESERYQQTTNVEAGLLASLDSTGRMPGHQRDAKPDKLVTDANGKRHGLVLSGGGAYGAFAVGVLKALLTGQSPASGYKPIHTPIITGTSIGAFNASVLASDPGADGPSMAERLESIWVNDLAETSRTCGNGAYRIRGNPLDYFDPACYASSPTKPLVQFADDSTFIARSWFRRGLKFLITSSPFEQKVLELVDISTLFSMEPLRQLLPKAAPLEGIRRSEKILKIAATNWKTGEVRLFGNADLLDQIGYQAILASTAIPGIFPVVDIAGVPYVDGGVAINTPLFPAIRAGADIIYLIFLVPSVRDIPLELVPNTIDTTYRQQVIEWAVKSNEDVTTVRWINRGLDALERLNKSKTLSHTDLRDLVRTGGPILDRAGRNNPYRKITIHQFVPAYGSNATLELLDFKIEHINRLIEFGFKEAAHHDCAHSNCVLSEE